ncbi:RNA polymerase sigma factor [Planobispora siamensis]|uniref:RNA polymerase sigma factor 70 region 4 type 2 domain-containing protein n=1 Tax=Planobispora siamensis TaxID=936338 RepID=A0A8J3SNV5_9ACTN|nr:sigma-70 family RNA polymerase sigma factor [Planobispora siamensis]GIH93013.1 hypothetical protein Psi01_36430 [Planobispora siamensis]
MNDSVLVEALRERDAGALAALYDSYAESLYRYCLSMLDGAENAQAALRDTLIVAEAHIHALADADRLKPWLFALARRECLRRRPAVGAGAASAEPPDVGDDQADLRVMAWNAIRSLPEDDRELLALLTVHGLSMAEVASLLRAPVKGAEAMLEKAKEELRDAVTAEVLARKGPYDCAERARILTGFSGELAAGMRERLVGHIADCDTCAPHRSRQVSANKVFDLLPPEPLPETLKVRLMSCFTDPELVPYRRYVARRAGLLDAAGFPVEGMGGRPGWVHAVAGVAAAVVAAAAIAVIFAHLGGQTGETVADIASGKLPVTGEPPGVGLPWDPEADNGPVALEFIPRRPAAQPGAVPVEPAVADPGGPPPDGDAPARPDRPDPTGSGPADPVPAEPDPSGEQPDPTGGTDPTLAPTRPPRDHQDGRPRPRPCPVPSRTAPAPKPTPTPTRTTAAPTPTHGTPTVTSTPTPTPTGQVTPSPTTPAPSQRPAV